MTAMKVEYVALTKKGIFRHVPLNEPIRLGIKLIKTIWRFMYKLNPDSYLIKYKARLVARGDLQVTEADTYTTTLAARTFRALMAIAAVFQLEIR
jgi:hypothetical protein